MDRRRRQVGDSDQVADFLAGEPESVSAIERSIRAGLGGFRSVFASELDDLVQEVLLELTTALQAGRFRGDGPLAAYATRLARFHAIDRWRRRRRWTWDDLESIELPARDPAPSHRVEEGDRLRPLLRLFAAMPAECQTLWRMIVRGLSYRQMADQLGVAAGTLRVRVLRCRQRALKARRDDDG